MAKCVNDIWAEFDKDGNGFLDREETKAFVARTLGTLQGGVDNAEFNEEAYTETFNTFDVDQTGKISKNEMSAFIKKVMTGN